MAGTTASKPIANMVTPQPNIFNIESEVLKVTSGISEKFVSEPSKAIALGDLTIGLKRFKNTIRWKEYFLINENEIETLDNSDELSTSSTGETISSFNSGNLLNTKLKPKNRSRNAPPGTLAMEGFFKELEENLLWRLDKYYDEKSKKKPTPSTSSDINQMLNILKNSSKVVVPTDKTNSFKIIETEDYKQTISANYKCVNL